MLYRFVDLFKTIRRYENWSEIFTQQISKKRHSYVSLRNGIKFVAPKNHPYLKFMVDETFFFRIHTPTGFDIEPTDVVVDIGANIGIFTLFAACRTKETVYAFEPSPKNVEFLKKNVISNKLNNVKVLNLAVSGSSYRKTKLYLRDSVGDSIFPRSDKTESYIEVSSVSLKEILNEIVGKEIDFLKMDCEGCEGLIFSSTPRECFRNIKKIVVEFHDKTSPLKHEEIQRYLEKSGFKTRIDRWIFSKDSPYGYLYGKRKNCAQK